MAIDGRTAEKLRGFLRELPPRSRALLLAELERSERRGEPMPGSDIILRELRQVEDARAERPPVEPAKVERAGEARSAAPAPAAGAPDRDGHAARLFFALLEPFFVDDAPEHVHPGRLARAAAAPMWEWIGRDLMPAEANAYAENVAKLIAANEAGKAAQAAAAFQDRVAQAIDKALADVARDDRTRRKVSVQIGTPRALDDVRYLGAILKARDVLAVLAGKLPAKIRNLTDEQIGAITAFVNPAAGRHRELYVMALVMVMARLTPPWQLIRVAIKAADSDLPTRITETPYGPAIAMVLAELERLVRELEEDLRRGDAMAQPTLLKDIHDASRGMRTELDLNADSPSARWLAAIRGQLAVALRPEIESAPGRVRRMLRVRGPTDIVPGSVLDAGDVAETEALLGFVGHCRTYANELAINEMTLRAFSEVQNYLETHVQPLLDGLRNAGKGDRNYRQSQFEAAVRFCAKVFGPEYAETLTKAADVAVANERKAAGAAKAAANG